MIFLTVGTQLPFDRLIGAVDSWASHNLDVKVFGQIGPTQRLPANFGYAEFIGPLKVDELVKEAEVIVAHAGMGSVLTALKFEKPIIIVPRRFALREHRNDHQMATARWLKGRPGIHIAWDEHELPALLDARREFARGEGIPPYASPALIGKLTEWISSV